MSKAWVVGQTVAIKINDHSLVLFRVFTKVTGTDWSRGSSSGGCARQNSRRQKAPQPHLSPHTITTANNSPNTHRTITHDPTQTGDTARSHSHENIRSIRATLITSSSCNRYEIVLCLSCVVFCLVWVTTWRLQANNKCRRYLFSTLYILDGTIPIESQQQFYKGSIFYFIGLKSKPFIMRLFITVLIRELRRLIIDLHNKVGRYLLWVGRIWNIWN